jgi:hypothetical protein
VKTENLSANRSAERLRVVVSRSVVCSVRNRNSVGVECEFVFVRGRRREGASIYGGRLCSTTVSVDASVFGFPRDHGTHLCNSCCQMRSREKTHRDNKTTAPPRPLPHHLPGAIIIHQAQFAVHLA